MSRRTRVTADDLALAATWLEAYEAQDDDDNGATMLRVAAWLRAESERREESALCRKVAAQVCLPPTDPRVRAAVARVRGLRS